MLGCQEGAAPKERHPPAALRSPSTGGCLGLSPKFWVFVPIAKGEGPRCQQTLVQPLGFFFGGGWPQSAEGGSVLKSAGEAHFWPGLRSACWHGACGHRHGPSDVTSPPSVPRRRSGSGAGGAGTRGEAPRAPGTPGDRAHLRLSRSPGCFPWDLGGFGDTTSDPNAWQSTAMEAERPFHLVSPLLESLPLSRAAGTKVYMKLENVQPTGSFKIRGIGHFCQEVSVAGGGPWGCARRAGVQWGHPMLPSVSGPRWGHAAVPFLPLPPAFQAARKGCRHFVCSSGNWGGGGIWGTPPCFPAPRPRAPPSFGVAPSGVLHGGETVRPATWIALEEGSGAHGGVGPHM